MITENLAGWLVRGAQAYRLFEDVSEAYKYASTWGIVTPVYHGPDVEQHSWTGNGPGVLGADNCQICGRFWDELETPICKDL